MLLEDFYKGFKMTYHLSCGHKSNNEFNSIMVKSYTDQGKRAVSYMAVCNTCFRNYMNDDLLLYSYQEAHDWLAKGDTNVA